MSKSGFCWADEVEKEEEEEEEKYLSHLQKSEKKVNPLGSARPREIVLQEKGIDWRKIDQSPIPRKENYTKGNGFEAELEENFENSTVCDQFIDGVDSMVPPLRYPPKNYMYLMKENQLPNITSIPQTILLNFSYEQHKENEIREFGMQNSFEGGILGRNPYPRDREKENLVELSQRDREWENMNSNTYGRHLIKDRSAGIGRGRRGIDEEWDNKKNDYDRRDYSKERRRSPLMYEPYDEGRVGCHYMNKDLSFGGNYGNFGVKPLQERIQNMDNLRGRQGFGARKYEVPHSARVDGGRVENHQWRRKLK